MKLYLNKLYFLIKDFTGFSKVLLILVFMFLSINCFGQIDRKLDLKYIKDRSLDMSVVISNNYTSKNYSSSLTLGFGQTIGNGYMSNSPLGKMGTGLLNSELYKIPSMLGTGYVKDFGWGSNGLEFGLISKTKDLKLDLLYTGYTNTGLLNFETPTNSRLFTKGLVSYSEDKIKDMRISLEWKF